MATYTKDQILNLFLDNTIGDISPADMRTFVTAIFDGKENNIQIVTPQSDLTYLVQNDLVIQDTPGKVGIYITPKDSPLYSDLILLASPSNQDIGIGEEGESPIVRNISGVDTIVWEVIQATKILGTQNIRDILLIADAEPYDTYIAADSSSTVTPPGVIGDGYSWFDNQWNNIGQLRGTQGPTGATGPQGVPGATGPQGLTGATGPQGQPGQDGQDGQDGAQGPQGLPGRDGLNGRDGTDGQDGVDGQDGQDGADGVNGLDGQDGQDGQDGVDGVDGVDGRGSIIRGTKAYSQIVNPAETDTIDGDIWISSTSDAQDSVEPGDAFRYDIITTRWINIGTLRGENSIIRGSKTYVEIVSIPDAQNGDIWISTTDDITNGVVIGEGLRYDISTGTPRWINIGMLVGTQGPQGPQGPQGTEGPQGPQGSMILPQDRKPLAEILQDNTSPQYTVFVADNGSGVPQHEEIGNDTQGHIVRQGDWMVQNTIAGVPNEWITLGQFQGQPGPIGPEGPEGPPAFDLQGQDTLENILQKPYVLHDAWVVDQIWNDPTNTTPGNDEQAREVNVRDMIICTDSSGTEQWVTIGPLGVVYATQQEAENGCTNGIDNKAISPKTLCEYTTYRGMLISDGSVPMDAAYQPDALANPQGLVTADWVENKIISGGSF